MTTATSTTTDLDEIRALNARYNFAIDEGTPEQWAATFTTDGVFHALIEGQTPRGHDELAAFVPLCRDTFGPMRHLTTNEVIDVQGETATQTCYLLFFAETGGTTSGTVCVYDDELRREGGAWRFSARKVRPVMPFSSMPTAG